MMATGDGDDDDDDNKDDDDVGVMRVPVRHLSSSSLLECCPNELARGHFG